MTRKIRVLIADDSVVARGLLREMLEADGGFEIVAEARNGQEAVELCQEIHPDLVTMDLLMPVMGGLDAIAAIMSRRAVPILVVSAVADARNAYAAVAMGAVEVVEKPRPFGPESSEFIAKAKLVAKVAVITHIRSYSVNSAKSDRLRDIPRTPLPAFMPLPPPPARVETGRVFALAASTGGPQALAHILSHLPATFPAPVLIAQHISDGFAQGMAQWLSTLSPLPVRLAVSGDVIQPGIVYLSPSEQHLGVTSDQRLVLIDRRAGDVYRPSCDYLLTAVAGIYRRRTVGIILSGMGSDGAKGMEQIAAAGGDTLAQDAETSVVYGMNRVAIDQGSVRHVLPLDAIAPAMIERAMSERAAQA